MDSVETRELAYFVAVAEELHFGRAAQRLGIAQPPLSRAIKQLERRMGVTLIERTSRKVTLTAAGEMLFREGGKALDAVAAAIRRAQRAGRPDPRLVLVMKPGGDGGLLTDVLAAYESEPGALAVDVHFCGVGEQAALLRDGRADVALLPYRPDGDPQGDLSGLDTEELLAERQVVVLPWRHRLATRTSVRLADLRDETMPRLSGVPEYAGSGPKVRDAGELMQRIALGQMIAVVPEHVRGYLRHDLVCVPVLDARTTTMLLAWPQGSRSPVLAAFVRAATSAAPTAGDQVLGAAAPDAEGEPAR